jgi:hypothetical protein
MAVQSDTSRISYAGNNSTSTSYAVPFVFLENAHLKAIAKTSAGVESVVTLTNHTGAGDVNGGTVRTSVAIPTTSTLTIYRDVPITQTTTYAEGGDFPAASHERALDKLTTITQQLDRRINTCIRGSEANQIGELNPPLTNQQHILSSVGGAAPSWQALPSLSIGPVISTGSTTARSVQDRFADIVNVKDFGAIGDGVTDDTSAIQAAITAQARKQLYFPDGTYVIASALIGTGLVYCTGSAGVVFTNYSVPLNTPDALLDFDFQSGKSTVLGIPANLERVFTTSRGSTGYVQDTSGTWRKVGENKARVSGRGILVEASSNNNARFNRDLSITHRVLSTALNGAFVDGETVTVAGDGLTGTGKYVTVDGLTSSSSHYIRSGSGTFGPSDGSSPAARLTGSTAGASATVTMTIASPCVVTWTAHGLSAGQAIRLTTTGALPTGLTAGTTYYLKTVLTDSFRLATTPDGADINTSGSQSGTHTASVLATAVISTSATTVTTHWQHTNVVVTQTVGIDGVAGSASRIEASANNATILTAITMESQLRTLSAFVRRVAGDGAVSMTQDNGSTWTAITLTNEWSRVSLPSATVTDPTVGFKIDKRGDIIEVDCVQHENVGYVTSPIPTLQASVTRTIDNVSMSWVDYPRLLQMRNLTTDVSFVPSQVVSSGTMFDITDGTNNNMLRNNYRISDYQAGLTVVAGGGVAVGTDPKEPTYVVAPNVKSRFVATFDMTNNKHSVSMDGSGRADANVTLPRTISSWPAVNVLNKLTMGAQQAALAPINGYIERFSLYGFTMSPEQAALASKL